MGSKNRIAKDILTIMQPEINKLGKYVEPFCGGCNMIDKVMCKDRWANDSNEYLIALLSHATQRLYIPTFISKEEYNKIRTHIHDYEKWYVGFVGFICSFRGKFFNGYAGNNIYKKTGNYQDYQKSQIKNFNNQIPNLIGVQFSMEQYYNLDITDSVIYCDPPYQGTTKYKVDEFNHERFWDWCRLMSKDNKVYISEYSAPSDFKCVWEKEILNNLRTGKATRVTEKLFTL